MTSNIAEAAPSRQLHPAADFSVDIVRDCGDDELSAVIAVAEAGARPSSPPVSNSILFGYVSLSTRTRANSAIAKIVTTRTRKRRGNSSNVKLGYLTKKKKFSSRCPCIVRQEKNRTYCFSMHRSQYSFMPVDSLINIIFGCLVLERQ